MTVSDFIIDFLVKKGINDIFLVSGGGIMYFLDAVGRNKKMNFICNHHEQASAIAAEAYARSKNSISACLVTTGPGATNAITGVACAWFDSIPVFVISGQQKRELIADYSKYRNLGPQEAPIVDMVRPITKYVIQLTDPKKVKYELEKAFHLATTGRPGPVWIDVPLDIQGMTIDSSKLTSFIPPKESAAKQKKLHKDVKKVVEKLLLSKRPVVIAGNGIRLSHGLDLLLEFIKKTKIPVILPFNGLDLLPENNPQLVGKFGPGGQRRGNFALQNSDLVLSIGSSLNVSTIGFNYLSIAPKALKIMVNIDKGEITKPTIAVDMPIQADAAEFLKEILSQLKSTNYTPSVKWMETCKIWKKKYPTVVPEFFDDKKHVNSYVFFKALSDAMTKDDGLVTGIGLDAVSMYQGFEVKPGQRAFVNKNFGPMGWCLPAGIGACIGRDRKSTVLVTGDGSFQFNSQELVTIWHNKLPLKIFVFNNGAYESIRATQNNLFDGRVVGADAKSGVGIPDFKKLAKVFDFPYFKIQKNSECNKKISNVLKTKGPVLCEVNISYLQKRIPKAATFRNKEGNLESKPLEDMAPFLPPEELQENMQLFDNE